MKMTLKNRIALAQELLAAHDYDLRSNDKEFVYHASMILGSNLSSRYNQILMNRNTLPLRWKDDPKRSNGKINFGIKCGCIKVFEYSKEKYDITPGRVKNLMDTLNKKSRAHFKVIRDHADKVILLDYLCNLNNLRMARLEMTEIEIYDFSFDMVYELIDRLSLSDETLALAFLIMYWIQHESGLIPLALRCDRDEFLAVLDSHTGDALGAKEGKKAFRMFMRKVLDLHLREFIRYETEGSDAKPKSRDRILTLIKDNPEYTAKMMAATLGLSIQAVQKQIAILKKVGRLERIGPDNGGRWIVLDKIKKY